MCRLMARHFPDGSITNYNSMKLLRIACIASLVAVTAASSSAYIITSYHDEHPAADA